MPDSIKSAINEGTIEVSNDVESNGYKRGQTNARFLKIGDGEASLIRLIVGEQNSNPAMQPLLVTNDKDALTAAKELDVKAQTIANILTRMTACRLVKCEDAIHITVKSLTRKQFHLLTL